VLVPSYTITLRVRDGFGGVSELASTTVAVAK